MKKLPVESSVTLPLRLNHLSTLLSEATRGHATENRNAAREWLHPPCMLKQVTQAMRLRTCESHQRQLLLAPSRGALGFIHSVLPPRPLPAEPPPSKGHWHPVASVLTLWKNLPLESVCSLPGWPPWYPQTTPRRPEQCFLAVQSQPLCLKMRNGHLHGSSLPRP